MSEGSTPGGDVHLHGLELPEGESPRGRTFVISILITCGTLLAEVLGGIFTGSLALLSDAAHVFLDIFALGLSYGAMRLASRAPVQGTPLDSAG